MGAMKSICIAKFVFTQKEFDKERKVNNNKWCHSTCKGDQDICVKPKR